MYYRSILAYILLIYLLVTARSKNVEPSKSIFDIFNQTSQTRFNIKMMSLSKCNIPESKWDPSKPVVITSSLKRVNRDVTVLNVHIEVTKSVGPLFISFHSYVVNQNAVKDLIFKNERAPCNHFLMTQMRAILNLDKIMDEKCMIYVGNHTINNLNLDSISGIMSKTIISKGIYSYDVEFSHTKGVLACLLFYAQVSEKKTHKP